MTETKFGTMCHSFRPCVFWIYLIEKFISFERYSSHNKIYERQRNHTIIYFCRLSTLCVIWWWRFCKWVLARSSARMPSLPHSESESQTIVEGNVSSFKRSKSKTDDDVWKLLSWVQVIVYGYCSEYLSFALCTLCSSTYRNDGSLLCVRLFLSHQIVLFFPLFAFLFSPFFWYFCIPNHWNSSIIHTIAITITITISVTIYSRTCVLSMQWVLSLFQ